MASINLVSEYKEENRKVIAPTCPKCGGHLIPDGLAVYHQDNPANKALEFWCEKEQMSIIIWQETKLAQYFLRDLQVSGTTILVNGLPAFFNPKIKKLYQQHELDELVSMACDGGTGSVTGNMFYDDIVGWTIEYWRNNTKDTFLGSPPSSNPVWQWLAMSPKNAEVVLEENL